MKQSRALRKTTIVAVGFILLPWTRNKVTIAIEQLIAVEEHYPVKTARNVANAAKKARVRKDWVSHHADRKFRFGYCRQKVYWRGNFFILSQYA